MDKTADLSSALDAFEALLRRIAATTGGVATHERRLELVKLRRELAGQIAAIGSKAEAVFADTPFYPTFRASFSSIRATAAAHQADWPAVRLGENEADYRASVLPMRAANSAFIRWTREALRAV